MNSSIAPGRKSLTSRRLFFALLMLSGVLLYAGRAGAGGSDIDMTFNLHRPGADNYVLKAAVQRDGKVIIGGEFEFYNGDITSPNKIMRLNADGTLDTSFNAGGAYPRH